MSYLWSWLYRGAIINQDCHDIDSVVKVGSRDEELGKSKKCKM